MENKNQIKNQIKINLVAEFRIDLVAELDKHERKLIYRALTTSRGNQALAARLLGIKYNAMRYRMERLGIEPPEL